MSKIMARLGTGEKEVQLQTSTLDGKLQYELIVNGVFIMASYNDLSSRELLTMDYLLDGVEGHIPAYEELLPMSRALVRELGLHRESLPPEAQPCGS